MAVSVDGLRQLVDAALAAGAAVEDDPGAASRAVATLDELAQQQVLLTGCTGLRGQLHIVVQEVFCRVQLQCAPALLVQVIYVALARAVGAEMLSKAAQAALTVL